MDERLERKYKRVLQILPDVAECAGGRLVLVGGTALALFHLNHRISIDLDFVPLAGGDVEAKEKLKGCLSRRGYRTARAAYPNQFVIQFEDASIKVEVFEPEKPVRRHRAHALGVSSLLVADLNELLEMKEAAFKERRAARDLYDLVFILKAQKAGFGKIRKLLARHPAIEGLDEMEGMALKAEDYAFFKKVMSECSPLR